MVHIRDVWVNWFEGEENGYNVCDFFEWRSDDRIEVLDQAFVVKVNEELFDYIENNICELPDSLLDAVYQKSYLRKNMSRIQLDYCFIATDGKRIIAVDTIGYRTPIRKSRLTPRQEQIVFELLQNEKIQEFKLDNILFAKEYHILSPSPEEMKGLTRKERQLKQLLFMALDQLFTSGNEAEVRYWYTEWDPTMYMPIQEMTMEEAKDSLFEEVKIGWTSRHYHLCEKMIKGQPFFEKLWELEHGESVK
ncbi:YjbA family protein [Bacillus alkalicellulosilyticus]|uniref:YjbA family protein n=1 Tax=Alkalihalobacterium alkalicellulosilyticum TaxID=1912214 RepID=UPI000996EB48|nr:YjbA family protein [Bacillus alkalicellulosilyticus]